MSLWMKQKVFSWVARFTIRDDAGNDRYAVEGEFLSLGRRLHLLDAGGNEAAYIEQKLLTFLPRFLVYRGGVAVAEIVREFTLFRPSYRIEGPDWTVDGDFFAHDYAILQGGRTIASITKEWFAWGDSYRLDVAPDADEVLAVAVVLAIDAVMDQRSHSAAISAGT